MDIEKIKKSMIVLIAGNEQRNMHITSKLSEMNIRFAATAMRFCDYSFKIPRNVELEITESIDFRNIVAIERKASLTELAGNLSKGRVRFENEFKRALESNCKVSLLIEDAKAAEKLKLRKILDKDKTITQFEKLKMTWRSAFSGNSMQGSLNAFRERYSIEIITCKKENSMEIMLEIFYKAIEDYFNGSEDKEDVATI